MTAPAVPKAPPITPEGVARLFHAVYEELAPSHGYATRESSAVPWPDVPEQNRGLMVATAARVIAVIEAVVLGNRALLDQAAIDRAVGVASAEARLAEARLAKAEAERDRLRAALREMVDRVDSLPGLYPSMAASADRARGLLAQPEPDTEGEQDAPRPSESGLPAPFSPPVALSHPDGSEGAVSGASKHDVTGAGRDPVTRRHG